MNVVHPSVDHIEDELIQAIEKLEQDSRRKDDYLTMIAHEIRNPLAPMQLAIELLTTNMKRSNAQELLELLARQVHYIHRLTTDLVDASKMHNGKLKVELACKDIVEVLTDILEDRAANLKKMGVSIIADLPKWPLIVMCDSVRLTQVIGNILDNAGKFTPRGGAVFIDMVERQDLGNVSIHIRDTGIGMTSEIKEHLFEHYAQGDMSNTRTNRGLGLGMSIARSLVLQHNGSIEARSEGPGTGSTFIVTLPLVG